MKLATFKTKDVVSPRYGFKRGDHVVDVLYLSKFLQEKNDDTRFLGLPLSLKEALKNWEQAAIEAEIRAFLSDHNLKLGDIAPALRAALTGTPVSPGIFDVIALLEKAEVLGRLEDQI